MIDAKARARFWAKVDVRGPDECWLWTTTLRNGYGAFHFMRRIEYSHRLSYQMAHGEIPDGSLICHTCDVRRCVNPSHLFAGTPQDNIADMVRKGRHTMGEAKCNAKLTDKAVLRIRELLANGSVTRNEIAQEFGVAVSQISLIARRKAWTHVQEDSTKETA